MFDYMLLPYGSHPSLKLPDAKESQVSQAICLISSPGMCSLLFIVFYSQQRLIDWNHADQFIALEQLNNYLTLAMST